MRLDKLMMSAVALLCIFSVQQTAESSTIQAGGADLNASKPNYSSDKIVTGGTPTEHTYEFSFIARFTVCDVTVRMEDEKGAEIQASASQGITQISVDSGDPPTSHGSTNVSPPNANGKHDCTPTQITPHTHFRVKVKAKATATAVKFSMSFSTKPATVSTSCTRLADFLTGGGNPIIARPFFPESTGLLIHITNEGEDPLAFGRFELMGAQPGIDEVIVPDTEFNVIFDGDNAFTLTGDTLEPQQTIQVFIIFDAGASEAGALIARFTGS